MLPVSINKPHHTQEHSTSCLPASAKMLLNFIGDMIEEAELRDLLGTTDRGTAVINILKLNASLPDVKAELHEWLLANLFEYLDNRLHPCIVIVWTGALPYWSDGDDLHAVVVHGFDDEHIFINDPYFNDQEFRVPIETFLAAWAETENLAITIERR